jgi:hypothetical protein
VTRRSQLPPHMEALLAKQDAEQLEREALASVGHRDIKPEKAARKESPAEHPCKVAKVSRTERDYGMRLQSQRMAGLLLAVEHQPDPIALPARRSVYNADYRVVMEGGVVRYVEVKGAKKTKRGGTRPHWWDAESKLKCKLAARILADRDPPAQMCVAWPAKGGGWHEEVLAP